MDTNIFDFSIFYLATVAILGVGGIYLILKDRIANIIEVLDEKSNGRSASH
ncbi:hypothetical protein [Desulfolucanica intricata]|uniref:hypothetical protein n=1 Tax=Desulfolucanica intricata TaxID=1285191 RepID=UPI000B2B0F95|nr:hypothetical protein [Desulfolucanica intricata]